VLNLFDPAPVSFAPMDAHLMTRPFFAPQSANESSRRQGPQGDASAAMSPSRGERLLLDAQGARGLVHRLALIDAEAQHRLAQHRSHFNPNQPRVPAGNATAANGRARAPAESYRSWQVEASRPSVQVSGSRSPPNWPSG